MTSQQTAAIVAAAGVGSKYPMIFADTAEEFDRATRLVDALGVPRAETRTQMIGGDTRPVVEYKTSDGLVCVYGPATPIHRLAAEAIPDATRVLADAYADTDRVALTAAGRAHLRVAR